jgi:hypothetical protein
MRFHELFENKIPEKGIYYGLKFYDANGVEYAEKGSDLPNYAMATIINRFKHGMRDLYAPLDSTPVPIVRAVVTTYFRDDYKRKNPRDSVEITPRDNVKSKVLGLKREYSQEEYIEHLKNKLEGLKKLEVGRTGITDEFKAREIAKVEAELKQFGN